MMIRKIALVLMLVVLWPLCLFAAAEDWNGTFVIKDEQGKKYTIIHTPKKVQALFMTVGNCLYLSKGSMINGLKIKEDVKLCTNTSVEPFIAEVQKLGLIEEKTITLGPTYS